jgi:hypothetical protein
MTTVMIEGFGWVWHSKKAVGHDGGLQAPAWHWLVALNRAQQFPAVHLLRQEFILDSLNSIEYQQIRDDQRHGAEPSHEGNGVYLTSYPLPGETLSTAM